MRIQAWTLLPLTRVLELLYGPDYNKDNNVLPVWYNVSTKRPSICFDLACHDQDTRKEKIRTTLERCTVAPDPVNESLLEYWAGVCPYQCTGKPRFVRPDRFADLGLDEMLVRVVGGVSLSSLSDLTKEIVRSESSGNRPIWPQRLTENVELSLEQYELVHLWNSLQPR